MVLSFADWKKNDIRVGLIETVEEVLGKDKLFKLNVNFGTEVKTVVSGIKPFYSTDELKGKKVAFIYNLEPALIAGIQSQAMILGVLNSEGKYKLLFVDDSVKEGTMVE